MASWRLQLTSPSFAAVTQPNSSVQAVQHRTTKGKNCFLRLSKLLCTTCGTWSTQLCSARHLRSMMIPKRVASYLCVCTSLTLRNKMSFLTSWNSLLTIPTQISQLVQISFVSHITKSFPPSASTDSSFKEIFLPHFVESKVKTLKFIFQQSSHWFRRMSVGITSANLSDRIWSVCLNDSHVKWIDSNYDIKDIQNSALQILFHDTEYIGSLIAKWIYLYQVILTKTVVIKPEIYLAW